MLLITDTLYGNEEVFSIYGKALLICQKYETTCKDIFKWFEITRAVLDNEKVFFSPDYLSYCEKLESIMLGKTIEGINNIKNRLAISNNDIGILTKAKNSRNWIIHESMMENILENLVYSKNEYFISKEMKNKIRDVIAGDFLVSNWSYEFHEHESFGKDNSEYIRKLLMWIGI